MGGGLGSGGMRGSLGFLSRGSASGPTVVIPQLVLVVEVAACAGARRSPRSTSPTLKDLIFSLTRLHLQTSHSVILDVKVESTATPGSPGLCRTGAPQSASIVFWEEPPGSPVEDSTCESQVKHKTRNANQSKALQQHRIARQSIAVRIPRVT